MKVRWAAQAEQDRVDIIGHIAADNVRAAIAIDELFGATAARLADFPLLGKPGQIAGTREWVAHESAPRTGPVARPAPRGGLRRPAKPDLLRSDRMIYEVDEAEQTVWVLALVPTARQWPPPRPAAGEGFEVVDG